METLARIAARLAGRVPGRRVTIRFGDMVAFDDVAWRYPDFLLRAEAAYAALTGDLPAQREENGAAFASPEIESPAAEWPADRQVHARGAARSSD